MAAANLRSENRKKKAARFGLPFFDSRAEISAGLAHNVNLRVRVFAHFHQLMPAFSTKMRHIYNGRWIICAHGDVVTHSERFEPLAQL